MRDNIGEGSYKALTGPDDKRAGNLRDHPEINIDINYEKREGDYHCVGCGVKLFESKTKYESGSGWPSFFEALPNVFETKVDNIIGYPRTEYHCKKCGGHHGHIFEDGPKPTGKRYCNNGACLIFKPKI